MVHTVECLEALCEDVTVVHIVECLEALCEDVTVVLTVQCLEVFCSGCDSGTQGSVYRCSVRM